MFTGLSAFPLTPLRDDVIDLAAFEGLVARLVEAKVDSVTALGSTGSYAYLDRSERRQVTEAAIAAAGPVPVIVGIGALRTSQVRALAEDAQDAGAAGVLLAPLTYQKHTEDDVFGLYEDVTADLSVPLVVYDNPGTTHFTFSDELYGRIAELPNVASIKIPAIPADPASAAARVDAIRARVPAQVTIGISGDSAAQTGLSAGCDVWYSVIGGTLPQLATAIARPALAGDVDAARAASNRHQPLWDAFAKHGSLRVTAAIAEHLGLVTRSSLPRPILGLSTEERLDVAKLVTDLGLQN
ncbi:dihydrodipicolinate synthase family protein [Pseudoclavibacter terrae]|uniref:Dihydrodipicolinate synthase family protein n=1 Tax=Pseudoclavibacter terrae TaxID=1530195 RepID=A0A7J5AY28_9MICO|nr:dihydrodipicolinate synthase family protein [Pseudoclavibacter terrae]KAB1636308.1 dihydrodipicolinate synthase family protein [Pseudoclavibacter terrae]